MNFTLRHFVAFNKDRHVLALDALLRCVCRTFKKSSFYGTCCISIDGFSSFVVALGTSDRGGVSNFLYLLFTIYSIVIDAKSMKASS